jgi:hypothetical protein
MGSQSAIDTSLTTTQFVNMNLQLTLSSGIAGIDPEIELAFPSQGGDTQQAQFIGNC